MARKPGGDNGGYEVGYGKPPAESRFQPGKSGNPSGRSRGSRRLSAIEKVLQKPITMVIDGKRRRVPATEAVVTQRLQRALQGDDKAAREILRLNEQIEKARSARPDEEPLQPATLTIMMDDPGLLNALEALGVTVVDSRKRHRICRWVVRAAHAQRPDRPWTDEERQAIGPYLVEAEAQRQD